MTQPKEKPPEAVELESRVTEALESIPLEGLRDLVAEIEERLPEQTQKVCLKSPRPEGHAFTRVSKDETFLDKPNPSKHDVLRK